MSVMSAATIQESPRKKSGAKNLRKSSSTKNKKIVELATAREARIPTPLSEDARERLITRSRVKARKLARSILRKWNARLELQEVDSIVDLSLCEAANRFDPKMGASFMTFLFYHLRGNLIRTIAASANSSLVPVYDNEVLLGSEEESRDPYRNVQVRGVNAIEIAEALCSRDQLSPDDALLKKEMLNLSREARSKLDTLAQEVLDRIYIQEEQLIDIAYSLGYSRCHISRVKKRALETLYDDLKGSLALSGSRPTFDDEEEGRGKHSRKIHRRRPRSKSAGKAKRHLSVVKR